MMFKIKLCLLTLLLIVVVALFHLIIFPEMIPQIHQLKNDFQAASLIDESDKMDSIQQQNEILTGSHEVSSNSLHLHERQDVPQINTKTVVAKDSRFQQQDTSSTVTSSVNTKPPVKAFKEPKEPAMDYLESRNEHSNEKQIKQNMTLMDTNKTSTDITGSISVSFNISSQAHDRGSGQERKAVPNKVPSETTVNNSGNERKGSQNNCRKLITEEMSPTTILTLFKSCVNQAENEDVEIGPLLLERLFVADVFRNVKCTPTSRTFLKGKDKNRQPIALASFQGSGNTWTRLLLEDMTGIYTGSVYMDNAANSVLKGSKVCPLTRTFIVKTHMLNSHIIRPNCGYRNMFHFRKAIYILRNPFDAVLAEFNRKNAGKIGTAHKENFESSSWQLHVTSYSQRFYKHVDIWLRVFPHPVYILVYENLQKQALWELYKLSEFIDFPVSFETMWCIKQKAKHQEVFKRKKPKWLNPNILYSSEMTRQLNNYLQVLSKDTKRKHHVDEYLKKYQL